MTKKKAFYQSLNSYELKRHLGCENISIYLLVCVCMIMKIFLSNDIWDGGFQDAKPLSLGVQLEHDYLDCLLN